MAQERIDPVYRELKFGGEGKAETIIRGFAFTSLRNPREAYNFTPGEVILANCFDDGEKIPVVVVANEVRKLKDFSVPQLALDGFFSANEAAAGMKAWNGYEGTTIDSRMQAITFVSRKGYEKLSSFLQHSIGHKVFNTLVRTEQLRHLFFPTMCQNLINNRQGIVSWMDFLHDNNLVHRNKIEAVKKAGFHGTNFYEFHKRHPRSFEKLLRHTQSHVFKALVCLQPDENEYH